MMSFGEEIASDNPDTLFETGGKKSYDFSFPN